MPTKNELLQFTITNNTTDCAIDVPLLSENSPTINARTKYQWDITGQNIACGCWNIVINGVTYLNSYDGTLLGLLNGFTNLGFGYFCSTTQGGNTYIYTLDDTNIYGDIDSCVCPTSSGLLYYPIVGSIVGWDTAAEACVTNYSAPYTQQVYWYGNLVVGTKLYLNTTGTSPLVVNTSKFYFLDGNWCSIDSTGKISAISTCNVPTTTTTTSTTTSTTTLAPTTTTSTTTSTTTLAPTTTTSTTTSTTTPVPTTTTTSTTTSTTTPPPTTTTTSTTTSTTTPPPTTTTTSTTTTTTTLPIGWSWTNNNVAEAPAFGGGYLKVYVNSTLIVNQVDTSSTSPITYSGSININVGDTIQVDVYAYANSSVGTETVLTIQDPTGTTIYNNTDTQPSPGSPSSQSHIFTATGPTISISSQSNSV